MKEEVLIIPSVLPREMPVKKEADSVNMPYITLSSGLPVVYVEIRNVGFSFLMDTSVRHSLIDPYLMEWIEVPEPTGSEFWDRYRPTNVIHKQLPNEKILCKDGIERECEMIQLDFVVAEIDGAKEAYSEPFALDPSMSSFFLLPKAYTSDEGIVQRSKVIAGILGVDFLMKNEWALDFGNGK